jgi:hypothetical protein
MFLLPAYLCASYAAFGVPDFLPQDGFCLGAPAGGQNNPIRSLIPLTQFLDHSDVCICDAALPHPVVHMAGPHRGLLPATSNITEL